MALACDLNRRQHLWRKFGSWKHPRAVLSPTSRLAGSTLPLPFWFSLRAQHGFCQWRLQWFVPVCTHSNWQSHLPAIPTGHLSGYAYVPLVTSVSGSIAGGIYESNSSGSSPNLRGQFLMISAEAGSAHWMRVSRALAFSFPGNYWIGMKAEKSNDRYLLLSWVLLKKCFPQDTLFCWVSLRCKIFQ